MALGSTEFRTIIEVFGNGNNCETEYSLFRLISVEKCNIKNGVQGLILIENFILDNGRFVGN